MKSELGIKPSEELAYWIGVVQTDGCLSQNRISIAVKKTSFRMLEKFAKISQDILKVETNIRQRSRNEPDVNFYRFTASKFIHEFKNLGIRFGDPPIPPFWITKNFNFFGAYLAGVLDGDGCITIKETPYRQCLLRITSGIDQTELAKAIEENLKCSTYFSRRKAKKFLHNRNINCKWVELGFVISSKNYLFIKKFILPHLMILHKKKKIEDYIASKYEVEFN